MTSGRLPSSQSRSGPEKWSDALTSGWRYKAATKGAYARSVTSEKTCGKFPAGWCWWKTSANRRRSANSDHFTADDGQTHASYPYRTFWSLVCQSTRHEGDRKRELEQMRTRNRLLGALLT